LSIVPVEQNFKLTLGHADYVVSIRARWCSAQPAPNGRVIAHHLGIL
jgi:hypothetical protein